VFIIQVAEKRAGAWRLQEEGVEMKVCNKVKEECGDNDTLVLVLRNRTAVGLEKEG